MSRPCQERVRLGVLRPVPVSEAFADIRRSADMVCSYAK
jgi:hypothetical protein